jgi:hypothetical protein
MYMEEGETTAKTENHNSMIYYGTYFSEETKTASIKSNHRRFKDVSEPIQQFIEGLYHINSCRKAVK